MPFTQCSCNLVLKFRLCITADCQERREGGKSGKLINDICAFKFSSVQSGPSVSVQEESADGRGRGNAGMLWIQGMFEPWALL